MESPGTEALRVEKLTKSYNHLPVLKGITFSVYRGELVCILGPSGCGKTTLLRIVSNLIPYNQGKISVYGKDVSSSQAHPQNIGVVFQEPRLLPWRNARNNVRLHFELEADKVTRQDEDVIDNALTLVGLSDFAEAFPYQLSGGMKQRVALARTLVADPQLLLMDEPLTGLDVHTREELQDEIINIWSQKGMGLVWVTHDPNEAIYLADRVIVLSDRPTVIKAVLEIPTPRPRRRNTPQAKELEEKIRDFFNHETH